MLDFEQVQLILFGAFLLAFIYVLTSACIRRIQETQSQVLRYQDEEYKELLPPNHKF